MLHAVMYVDQILEMYQVRVVLTEFVAGQDPYLWESKNETLTLESDPREIDALSTLLEIIRLWSERTIQD